MFLPTQRSRQAITLDISSLGTEQLAGLVGHSRVTPSHRSGIQYVASHEAYQHLNSSPVGPTAAS